MSEPLVSVILPVFNGDKTIEMATDSILRQQYRSFELIIIDDASTDNSFEVLKGIKDDRIKLFHNAQNLGLVSTLNRGIQLASGILIARQDQDDLSHPLRFTEQVKFLEEYPEYDLVGSWAEVASREKSVKELPTRQLKHPSTNLELQWQILWNNPFVHSSVMIRADILKTTGVYSGCSDLVPPEDYELWSRISHYSMLANIPDNLITYFHSDNGMSGTMRIEIQEKSNRISVSNLKHTFPFVSENKLTRASRLFNGISAGEYSPFEIASSFLTTLRLRRDFRQRFGRTASRALPINSRNFFRALASWFVKVFQRGINDD